MMKLSRIALATSLALGVVATAHAANDTNTRYIVTYKSDAVQAGQSAMHRAGGKSALVLGNQHAEAVYLDDAGLANLKADKNIEKIEEDFKRYPTSIWSDDAGDPMTTEVTPYGVYQTQANQMSFATTADLTVCIIDAGMDATNTDFNWNNVTGTNDSGTGNWYENGGPHGTHVAGTIAALGGNNRGVVGMVGNGGVKLHIVKVFNEAGWGYSSDLAHATDVCTANGADIISMSLGGGGANSTEENAFNNFVANGGLVVAAAGNDGNNVRSYPAGYSSVMMVGAVDADNLIASFSQFPPITKRVKGQTVSDETIGVEISAPGVDTLSTYPAGMATVSNMTANSLSYASSAMENLGSASGSTYNMGTAQAVDNGANGKVCVIERGVISFHDKVLNCENSGGIGAIIYNNVAGMLYGTLGDATTNVTSIPVVGATMEDGPALVAATTATVSVGPSDFGFMSGTSMATPAVSGVAALVWSHHTDCTGTEIRDALKAAAEDQGTAGRDDYYGYGIVKAAAASAYLDAHACTGGTPPPPPPPTCTKRKCR